MALLVEHPKIINLPSCGQQVYLTEQAGRS